MVIIPLIQLIQSILFIINIKLLTKNNQIIKWGWGWGWRTVFASICVWFSLIIACDEELLF